jgi:hydroxymethylglutaryl-CoA reductase (NADPH)
VISGAERDVIYTSPMPPRTITTSPPRDREDDFADHAVQARRAWTGIDLPYLAGRPVPAAAARGNVELFVGHAQVPVGVVGPVRLLGDFEGSYAVPMATCEGTMVASYQRGLKVCGDGIRACVLRDGLAVWPILSFVDIESAGAAARFVDAHKAELCAAAEATTAHGKVTELSHELLGRRLLLRLEMTTGDAHGINMVTKAAGALVARIPGATMTLLHGHDVEKRASLRCWRGKWVVAEALVPKAVVEASLKTTAAAIEELWATYQLAYARMGTANHAIQIANGLAGIYVATGQDVAYVAESSVGTLSLEDRNGDLYATLDLPNLHAATVGGGTGKGTAAEGRAILGVESARELACVMAATLLAGEINLAASFLGDDFVGAHERLGRNRPSSLAGETPVGGR